MSHLAELREWIVFLIDAAILYVLVVEYYFDKKVYESKRKRVKRTKIYCILKERGYAVRRQVVIDAISISGGKIKVDFFVEGV